MTTLPTRMTDRWRNRAEPKIGEGTVYWHMLMNDQPAVVDLVRDAQQRLRSFPGLHMTPLDRLHMTTLAAGSAADYSDKQQQQMLTTAAHLLSGVPPVTVTVGGFIYHPEAIVLAVKPARALAPIRHAVQAATRAVSGDDGQGQAERWLPHITVCYSTADQPAEPIAATLESLSPGREIQIRAVSLVIQRGPERLWDWHTVGTIPFPALTVA